MRAGRSTATDGEAGAAVRAYVADICAALHELPLGPIERLLDLLERTYRADGSIFVFGNGGSVQPYFPWAASPEAARETYRRAVAAGVMRPGSPVIHTTTRADVPDEFRFVDMGEWLIARALLLEVPLAEEFTPEQEATVGEDDLWLAALTERGEPLAGTGKPTLRYHMDGMSTVDNP